jgi:hypothetical protein
VQQPCLQRRWWVPEQRRLQRVDAGVRHEQRHVRRVSRQWRLRRLDARL